MKTGPTTRRTKPSLVANTQLYHYAMDGIASPFTLYRSTQTIPFSIDTIDCYRDILHLDYRYNLQHFDFLRKQNSYSKIKRSMFPLPSHVENTETTPHTLSPHLETNISYDSTTNLRKLHLFLVVSSKHRELF